MADDLISRSVLLRKIKKPLYQVEEEIDFKSDDPYLNGKYDGITEVMKIIKEMPEADPDLTEVIRCKDCFYWGGDEYDNCQNYYDWRPCGKFNEYMSDKGYCSCAYEKE